MNVCLLPQAAVRLSLAVSHRAAAIGDLSDRFRPKAVIQE